MNWLHKFQASLENCLSKFPKHVWKARVPKCPKQMSKPSPCRIAETMLGSVGDAKFAISITIKNFNKKEGIALLPKVNLFLDISSR